MAETLVVQDEAQDERAEFFTQMDTMAARFKEITHRPTCNNHQMALRIIDQRRCGAVAAKCMGCGVEILDGPHFGNVGQTSFGMSTISEYAVHYRYPVIFPGQVGSPYKERLTRKMRGLASN